MLFIENYTTKMHKELESTFNLSNTVSLIFVPRKMGVEKRKMIVVDIFDLNK